MSTVQIGQSGEDIAIKYLQNIGYKIIERNYRIRGGEMDVIAWDKDQLVFVEVKTRYSHNFGLPIESITPGKIRSLLKTIQFYLCQRKLQNKLYRLDCLLVDFTYSKEKPKIELIHNILN